MVHLRSHLAFFLVVVMVLTAHSMAVARGSAMSMGQIVLCTGTGPVLVNVDEDGQPVSPPHICPECALTEFSVVEEPGYSIDRPLETSKVQWNVLAIISANAQRRSTSARDPPLV
ncbi:MAG: hypothetical protein ABJI96_18840 [Paracoccaceae bacterium]